MENKEDIIKSMHLRLTILSRKGELDQIQEGLKNNGVLHCLCKYPNDAKKLFRYNGHEITAEALLENMSMIYSEDKENKSKEKGIFNWWEDYLQDVEGKGQVL